MPLPRPRKDALLARYAAPDRTALQAELLTPAIGKIKKNLNMHACKPVHSPMHHRVAARYMGEKGGHPSLSIILQCLHRDIRGLSTSTDRRKCGTAHRAKIWVAHHARQFRRPKKDFDDSRPPMRFARKALRTAALKCATRPLDSEGENVRPASYAGTLPATLPLFFDILNRPRGREISRSAAYDCPKLPKSAQLGNDPLNYTRLIETETPKLDSRFRTKRISYLRFPNFSVFQISPAEDLCQSERDGRSCCVVRRCS